jgi:hypothetical protein
VDKDLPAIAADIRKGPTFLYLEVDDLEAVKTAIAGVDVYMPERTTFYGCCARSCFWSINHPPRGIYA